MAFYDPMIEFVQDKPWVAVGAVVVGVGAVVLVTRRTEPEGEDAEGIDVTTRPLADIEPGFPAVILSQPSMQAPPAQQVPQQSFVSILREGRTIDVTAGPSGLCPPGYVSAQQPGQPARCTLVNPATKVPGQRTSFFPSRGEGAFV